MKTYVLVASSVLLVSTFSNALAQGSAFNYQGRLSAGGGPAHGPYDFQFKLFGTATGPGQVGGTIQTNAVAVDDGSFVVTLDFGAGFPGSARWIEIGIRTNGGNTFQTLAPRQPVTSTPYAIRAAEAGQAAVAASVGTGAVGSLALQNNSVNSTKIEDGTIVAGDLSPALRSETFWGLAGNAGTTAGVQFLGTTDNQPLELKVRSDRVLRLEMPVVGQPNVIAGSGQNAAQAGVLNVTIGGGLRQRINNSFATIGGGADHLANGYGSTIAGGRLNTNTAEHTVIGGGLKNLATGSFSGVTSGADNAARGFGSVVAGGRFNVSSNDHAAVGGGYGNEALAMNSTVGGGEHNLIEPSAAFATIAGGIWNIVQSNAHRAAIGGGDINTVQTNAPYATIGGGYGNRVLAGANHATIAGGQGNHAGGSVATVGGGYGNRATGQDSAILGGSLNTSAGFRSTVGGGYSNLASNYAATVPGGEYCQAIGHLSLAAGRRARANHYGAFVWGDGTDADITSTGDNQFVIRATGGMLLHNSSLVMDASSDNTNGLLRPGLLFGSGYTGEGISSKRSAGGDSAWGLDFYTGHQKRMTIRQNGQVDVVTGAGTIQFRNESGMTPGLNIANSPNAGILRLRNALEIWPDDTRTRAGMLDVRDASGLTTLTLDGSTGRATFRSLTVTEGFTTPAQALDLSVGQTRALRLEPTYSDMVNVIGGSSANFVGAGIVGATIGGGGARNYWGEPGTNSVHAAYGTIGGGFANSVHANAQNAVIPGGKLNTIQRNASSASIGGGLRNTIQTNAQYATIAGGAYNTIQTNAEAATIGGGDSNTVETNAMYAAIGGGYGNSARGYAATVPGGENNRARGNHSFAAGRNALAAHHGSFVWADTTGGWSSTGPNQFLIRATGGVGIGTVQPTGALLDVEGDIRLNDHTLWLRGDDDRNHGLEYMTWGSGIDGPSLFGWSRGSLAVGQDNKGDVLLWDKAGVAVRGNITANAFIPISDRNAKQDFAPVDPQQILDLVAALPLQIWSYTNSPNVRHIGPMAQDFKAAFEVGDTNLGIATVDADGVALAAIQGLNQRLEEKNAEIADLKERVARLEEVVLQLSGQSGGAK